MPCGWLIFDGIRKETLAEMLGAEMGKLLERGYFSLNLLSFPAGWKPREKGGRSLLV